MSGYDRGSLFLVMFISAFLPNYCYLWRLLLYLT
ncbi:hypothetical protein SAMN05216521_10689 [Enterocloster clostridioformis]|uniref:Uncharacterized protein n=2 Tax=Enterocloster clostridioformis TaxID=1531 RepID=A0A1I0JU75_9FIRM|nr:hypothetical protein HMPREF1090_03869 [[Clostridium] clostridioforme 90A8]SEU14034.1 hypothetical protein SAMN05216521_10689 [Enterocloster clostridioformis]SEW47250.1 hypothetical protein SAMN05216528_106420 [Enterocloster clostridioformis]